MKFRLVVGPQVGAVTGTFLPCIRPSSGQETNNDTPQN